MFETGTESLEWNLEKPLPCGPNGLKGVISSSLENMDLPSVVCAVTIKRGAGNSFAEDILI
jgi:hypothetical protein